MSKKYINLSSRQVFRRSQTFHNGVLCCWDIVFCDFSPVFPETLCIEPGN